jgi:hypothetical protein
VCTKTNHRPVSIGIIYLQFKNMPPFFFACLAVLTFSYFLFFSIKVEEEISCKSKIVESLCISWFIFSFYKHSMYIIIYIFILLLVLRYGSHFEEMLGYISGSDGIMPIGRCARMKNKTANLNHNRLITNAIWNCKYKCVNKTLFDVKMNIILWNFMR